MRGDLKVKDVGYYKFGKNEDCENPSEIEKIVRLKEKKERGGDVDLIQKGGVIISPFKMEVKEIQRMEVN